MSDAFGGLTFAAALDRYLRDAPNDYRRAYGDEWMDEDDEFDETKFVRFIARAVKSRRTEKAIYSFIQMQRELTKYFFFDLFNIIFYEDSDFFNFNIHNAKSSIVCDLWKNASYKLKRPVIQFILRNTKNLTVNRSVYDSEASEPDSSSDAEFNKLYYLEYEAFDAILWSLDARDLFLSIISDAKKRERIDFWNRNWIALFKHNNSHDFNLFADVCLKSERALTKFINNLDFETINGLCIELLKTASFEEFNELLDFCYRDEQTRVETKQKILSSYLLSLPDFIENDQSQNTINGVYHSAELIANFKNQLLVLPKTIRHLLSYVDRCFNFRSIKNFVNAFASSEQDVLAFKQHFVSAIRKRYNKHWEKIQSFDAVKLEKFLKWCLGSDDDTITNFKKTLHVEKLIEKWTTVIGNRRKLKKLSEVQEKFLKWYFVTDSAVKKFKKNIPNHKN